MKKGFLNITIIAGLLLVIIVGVGDYSLVKPKIKSSTPANRQALSTPTPTPFVFRTYTPPKIERKNKYTIFMIGDSMTHALGPHGGTFYQFINDLYKKDNIGILVDNYAVGSTNILSVNYELTKKTTYWDSTLEPLLSRDFDLILIESFGYNPLSSFGIEEGIKRQNQALDELMKTIITTHPQSAIVFVATIAPNKETYAKKIVLNITVADRIKQAEERMTYIKNHIEYAKSHNLPIIDIYNKSLNTQGNGDLKYINPTDSIHPSFVGVDFIGHEIANYIYDNRILPI